MIHFQLRSQHTGQVREFTLLDLLRIIGDTVNDEIRFNDGNREEAYKLSSFQESSAGSSDSPSAGVRLVNESISFAHGQRSIALGSSPQGICMIFLNGLKLREGTDYSRQGRNLEMIVLLQSDSIHTDILEALYEASPAAGMR